MRKIRKKIKRLIKKAIVKAITYLLPAFYRCYFYIVWATSQVKDDTQLIDEADSTPPCKYVVALWHQDVACVTWAFSRYKPHTITSTGDCGEIISNLLTKFNFTVFRGGSSRGSRRRKKVLKDFIEHLRHAARACVGITVDGSSGPRYHLKRGVVVMASELDLPMYIIRIWSKRRLILPTWDCTMIPLPFSKILIRAHGPFYPPAGIKNDELAFERFRQYLENRLMDLSYECCREIDGEVPKHIFAHPEQRVIDSVSKTDHSVPI